MAINTKDTALDQYAIPVYVESDPVYVENDDVFATVKANCRRCQF